MIKKQKSYMWVRLTCWLGIACLKAPATFFASLIVGEQVRLILWPEYVVLGIAVAVELFLTVRLYIDQSYGRATTDEKKDESK